MGETPVFLSEIEEKHLIEKWRCSDGENVQDLLLPFKPLVAAVVKKYQHYGILKEDLLQEAWLGLCIALYKYDTTREVRFATYARWWVNHCCQDFVLRNWSIVRVGSTTTHKKLFFQLKYLKKDLEKIDPQYLEADQVQAIAEQLDASVALVQSMHDRFTQKDQFLDQKIYEQSDTTYGDLLASPQETIEEALLQRERFACFADFYKRLPEILSEREIDILLKRKLHEPPQTLQQLSVAHSITMERVRQIELRALVKLRAAFADGGR